MSQVQDPNEGLIFLEKVRLSFPHLSAPHASAVGAVAKFSGDFIMDPTHPGYAQFMAQLQAVALAKFGAQADGVLQYANMDKKLRCYGAGEECVDPKTMQPYAGYPGNVYVKANNETQPALFGADGVQVLDARQFYGGCYVNAQVKPWPQDNTHGKTVRCELVGIQFHSDGEAFGAAPVDPSTLFGAVAGAPAAVAPGVAGVAAAQIGVAPVVAAPVGIAPGVPVVPVQAPGGYVAPAAPAIGIPASVAPVGVAPVGVAPVVAAPVVGVVTPPQPVGINPATGLPY